MKIKQKTTTLTFTGDTLEKLTKLWKLSPEPNDFRYFLLSFIKQNLKNEK